MDQACADLFRCHGQIARADGIHLKSGIVVGFAAVYIGKGGAVDNGIRVLAAHKIHRCLTVGDVQLIHIHCDHRGVAQALGHGAQLTFFLPQLLLQLGAQLPVAACDQNFHASSSVLISVGVLRRCCLSTSIFPRPHSSNGCHRAICRSARRFPSAFRG